MITPEQLVRRLADSELIGVINAMLQMVLEGGYRYKSAGFDDDLNVPKIITDEAFRRGLVSERVKVLILNAALNEKKSVDVIMALDDAQKYADGALKKAMEAALKKLRSENN